MMDDLISRQAALEALEQIRWALWEIDIPSPTVPEYIEHHEGVQSVMRRIDDIRKKMEMLPSAQQWISVSERLPCYGEDVLLSIDKYCNVGHLVPTNEETQCEWYYSGWYHPMSEVDAWAELPPVYEGET